MPNSQEVLYPPVTDQTMRKLIKEIDKVSLRSSVVNNLTTDSSTSALSAGMGKKLNDEKYEKPSTGIPKTDLSSDVQSSLNVFGASGSEHSSGLVPDPGSTSGTTKYLREDGTWEVPSGTGEVNVIESISVNGTPQTITNKNVDITVPVVASSIADAETGYTTGDQVYDYVQTNKGDVNVIETVKVNGSALTPDSNKAVDVTVPVIATAVADGETGYTSGDQVYDYIETNKSSWGDANVIEIVKVNGSALTPDANKAVDVTVPTVAASIADGATGYTTGDQVYDYVQANKGDTNVIESITIDSITQTVSSKVCALDLSSYAKKTDISSVFKLKGSKTSDELEALTGMTVGDVYSIKEGGSGTTYKVGSEYAYNGTIWFELGPVVDLSGYVEKTQKVNNKALSGDVTLNGSDLALTGYTKASSSSAVAATDTINQAIGKVEKKVDDAVGAATTYAFAEGSVNGAFQVTPTVGGTTGSASSVSIHGLGSAAYAATTDFVSSTLTPAEAGAEANVIETVKVNGSALTPDANKAVNVIVPSVATAIADGDTGYATGSQVYNYLSDDKSLLASAFSELSTLIQHLAFTSDNNNAQDTIEAFGKVISSLNGTGIIIKRLTGCVLSNAASSINIGESYTSSLIPNEDVFMFTTVSVRMNGVDITSTAWNSTTETITIPSVTGPISITAVADVVLPTGYTRLNYIAANGNQYTVLNVEEGDATRAVYEIMVTAQVYRKGNHILSGYRTYFPFFRTTSGGDGELGATNRGNETAASGGSKLYNWSLNQRYKLEGFVGENEVLKVDGTTIYSLPKGGSQDLTTPLAIFDYRGPGGGSQDYKFRGRLYSMSIYGGTNETLLKKFVPCKNSSNVAGLYDLVENIFYTSDTETAYIAGEEA